MSGSASRSEDKLLSTSWFDSAGIASLSQHNVLDYFSQRSNPFYDRTCNNEVVKMQRVDPAQLM
jgi:mediator of RNA polymerase II transcription subunit 6